MARPTNDELAAKKKQKIVDDVERELLEAAPSAAKMLAGSIRDGMPLSREMLAATTLILERTLGKTGTVKPTDPQEEKLNEFLGRIAAIREAEANPDEEGNENLVASGEDEV
jgi:hypothetical protein